MSLTFHFHPLSSYCQKALIALYENDTPFERRIVDLGNAESRAAFRAIWPIAKMPVLQDHARGETVAEASVVIEYLGLHYAGKSRLVPADPDAAWRVRMRDRFYDLYVNDPVGKIVTDKLRPAGSNDPYGVARAKEMLHTAYAMTDAEMKTKTWAAGDSFTMADCAAAPALFYANKLIPLSDGYKHAAAYLGRLLERPSYARAIEEAQPYFALFPG